MVLAKVYWLDGKSLGGLSETIKYNNRYIWNGFEIIKTWYVWTALRSRWKLGTVRLPWEHDP